MTHKLLSFLGAAYTKLLPAAASYIFIIKTLVSISSSNFHVYFPKMKLFLSVSNGCILVNSTAALSHAY